MTQVAHWFPYGLGIFLKHDSFSKDTSGAIPRLSFQDLKIVLVKDTWTPNPKDVDASLGKIYSDLVSSSAQGYDTKNVSSYSPYLNYDSVNNRLSIMMNDIIYPNSTITARYVLFYVESSGYDTSKAAVLYIDLGENRVSENGEFRITFNPTQGVASFTLD